MPKLTVYLPEDLLALMKALNLSPSEVIQDGVRRAARLDELRRELDTYLTELRADVGEPTSEEVAWAEKVTAPLKELERAQQEQAEQDRAGQEQAAIAS